MPACLLVCLSAFLQFLLVCLVCLSTLLVYLFCSVCLSVFLSCLSGLLDLSCLSVLFCL